MIKVISSYLIEEKEMIIHNREEIEYCSEIIEAIKNHRVVAVTDALVKQQYIGGYFKIAIDNNKLKESGMIWSNKWQYNSLKVVEALILFNLIKKIAKTQNS